MYDDSPLKGQGKDSEAENICFSLLQNYPNSLRIKEGDKFHQKMITQKKATANNPDLTTPLSVTEKAATVTIPEVNRNQNEQEILEKFSLVIPSVRQDTNHVKPPSVSESSR